MESLQSSISLILQARTISSPSVKPIERQVSQEEAKQYFESVHVTYFETSASRNINVENSFQEVTRLMRKANLSFKQAEEKKRC